MVRKDLVKKGDVLEEIGEHTSRQAIEGEVVWAVIDRRGGAGGRRGGRERRGGSVTMMKHDSVLGGKHQLRRERCEQQPRLFFLKWANSIFVRDVTQ